MLFKKYNHKWSLEKRSRCMKMGVHGYPSQLSTCNQITRSPETGVDTRSERGHGFILKPNQPPVLCAKWEWQARLRMKTTTVHLGCESVWIWVSFSCVIRGSLEESERLWFKMIKSVLWVPVACECFPRRVSTDVPHVSSKLLPRAKHRQ